MKKPFLVSLLLAGWFVSTGTLPAIAGDDEVLGRLQRLSSGIETLSSEFVQEKYLSVFKDMVVSRGRFCFKKPDTLRWELTKPVATGFVLKGKEGRRWHERTGLNEKFDINREPVIRIVAQQLMAWTRADFDRLRKEYRIAVISENPVTLRLDPLFGTGGFLDHLRIAFSEDGRHVKIVELREKDGDFTRIRFENTLVNQSLPDGLF
ncbi:MAG: outer membrane lipoprotein carrier protein LolA [Nitrospirota bacterium]|nr:outer membrane lipoprotein carrier protein LolA [Nitrospirota bacterium]